MHQRTRIKICGLTRREDVDAAIEAGADALGFVFYARSPRCVGVEQAAVLARDLPPFVTPVGLFVNASPNAIAQAAQAIPQLLLQFHGDESPKGSDDAAARRGCCEAVSEAESCRADC